MKKIVSVLLAVLMLASVLTVYGSARGYTLAVPSTISAHNLSAYGLKTMKVFSTTQAPTVDGVIGTGEYPGPNNGCSASCTIGNGLWMSSHGDGNIGSYGGGYDFTGYTADQDTPEYINSYLTYDQDFLYFGVSTVIQQQTENFLMDTRCSFVQSDDLIANDSRAWTRYMLSCVPTQTTATSVSIYCASDTTKTGRLVRSMANNLDVSQYLDYYTDEFGTKWNGTTYAKSQNFNYKITVLRDGRWSCVFEGRLALCDVLRITDVEFEDGTPIDYVPEWGSWGFDIRLAATEATTDIEVGERIFAQTMLPAVGIKYTGTGSVISGMTFSNSFAAATKTRFGASTSYAMAPVHYLGVYDPGADYDNVYYQAQNTAAKSTTRVTRTKNLVLTSAVRGVNGRVVGVATRSSDSTGDTITIALICVGAMAACAAAAFVVMAMKKRGRN